MGGFVTISFFGERFVSCKSFYRSLSFLRRYETAFFEYIVLLSHSCFTILFLCDSLYLRSLRACVHACVSRQLFYLDLM
jgi:hypothetical protein